MDAVQRLERFLKDRGWSTADLARATGLSHSTLSKILHRRRSAGLAVALRIQEVTREWASGPIRIEEWDAVKQHAGT